MESQVRVCGTVAVIVLLLCGGTAHGQTLHVSFDAGLKSDLAAGRSDPWVSRGVELVPGKFGMAAHVGTGGQLIYAGEQNILAGRGTLACWCRIAERPGPQANGSSLCTFAPGIRETRR